VLDLNEHVSLNASFAALESRMKQLAADDGDTYLPNVLPCSPADYIFIGMEPSLGSWAGNAGSKAEEMLRDGFRLEYLVILALVVPEFVVSQVGDSQGVSQVRRFPQ